MNKNLFSHRAWLAILLLPASIAFTSLSGCDKAKVDEMVASAKEKAAEFSEKSDDAFEKAKASATTAADAIKKTANETASKVKESASNFAGSAADLAGGAVDLVSMNGNAKITLDSPTDFTAAYVRVVNVGTEQSVFQLKSYSKDGQSTTYPAFFIQGAVAENSLGSLAGQTISCRLFAQKTADGEVWENAPGQLINVQFQKSQDSLTASFSAGSLVSSSGAKIVSNGKFECVLLEH